MPTQDQQSAVRREEVRDRVAAIGFLEGRPRPERDSIGLEPEMFALHVDERGRPGQRVELFGAGGILETIDQLRERESWIGARDPQAGAPLYPLAQGGTLTFEPGGQIEHSTVVHPTAIAAQTDVDETRASLCRAFAERGARLVKAGVDVWHSAEELPQMLRSPRYPAMAAYFASRSTAGRLMMRNSASMQVNLDLGPPDVMVERWLVAYLATPWITATFAASPGEGLVSTRARAWQELDPTRTGFADHLVLGPANDPPQALTEVTLDADVLLFRLPGGGAEPGVAGFSFGRWIDEGHPEHGWPTDDDLVYHLTTMFHEVRCRGFFEVRSVEALPEPWHVAPVVLVTALLYDERARRGTIALLEGQRAELRELWRRAAVDGLRDELLGELAGNLWEQALAGARRMPAGFFSAEQLHTTERFLERFVAHRRMPSDELREALAEGPERALAWAMGSWPCPETNQAVG